MACGSGDAQTIAVTDSGVVYSWGDGDYGKLGRGGSDGSKVPKLVDKLQVSWKCIFVLGFPPLEKKGFCLSNLEFHFVILTNLSIKQTALEVWF